MKAIVLALKRSLCSLRQVKVWYYIALPALAAVLAMTTLAITLLGVLIAGLMDYPPMTWLNALGAFWAAKLLAVLGGWVTIVSVSYLLSLFLTAVFTLPQMIGWMADRDYPDLARRGRDTLVASLGNSVLSILLFVLGWALTLPLWLLPGFSIILSFFWMAWLNRRVFSFDTLAPFVTPEEWKLLKKQEAMPLLLLGFLMSLLTLLPFAGLVSPPLAALAYGHFCLEALQRLRAGASAQRLALPGSRE